MADLSLAGLSVGTSSSITASASGAEVPLSPNLLRNLGDRSYDKRKGAALEVENLVKQLAESGSPQAKESIPLIIDLLQHQFTCSTNANYRKGGLIGLAGTAIGLMHDAKLYLDLLMPPVLHCFDDPESRVRYILRPCMFM